MTPARIVIAANRLPVSAGLDAGAVTLKPSEGGLATGIRPWYERTAGVWVGWPGGAKYFPLRSDAAGSAAAPVENDVRAPMTAKVVKIAVAPGAAVKAGEIVVVLEAMKMEYRLAAPRAGTVEAVRCKEGELVDLGATLVVLK